MDQCCGPIEAKTAKFKKALWVALAVNSAMFIYEFGASFLAQSSSLKADSLDFLGDSANYAVSLLVVSRSLQLRAKASLIKGLTMGVFGLWVAFATALNAVHGIHPDSEAMTWVGIFALIANVFVAILLYRFRDGDSNMKSVWLCSRNDAIGNLAVIAAAGAVFYFQSMWPDLIVAAFMAYLSLSSSVFVIRAALSELRHPEAPAAKSAGPTCQGKT